MYLLILNAQYLDLVDLFRASKALHVCGPVITLVNSTRGEFTLIYFEPSLTIIPTNDRSRQLWHFFLLNILNNLHKSNIILIDIIYHDLRVLFFCILLEKGVPKEY